MGKNNVQWIWLMKNKANSSHWFVEEKKLSCSLLDKMYKNAWFILTWISKCSTRDNGRMKAKIRLEQSSCEAFTKSGRTQAKRSKAKSHLVKIRTHRIAYGVISRWTTISMLEHNDIGKTQLTDEWSWPNRMIGLACEFKIEFKNMPSKRFIILMILFELWRHHLKILHTFLVPIICIEIHICSYWFL